MKHSILFAGLILLLIVPGNKAFAGGGDTAVVSMIVYGNSFCKARIETLVSGEKGVLSAVWNSQDMQLEVKYLSTMISVKRLGQQLAGGGFDNEYYLADDAAYTILSGTSKYTRPGETKINSDRNNKAAGSPKVTDDSRQNPENRKVEKLKKEKEDN